MTFWDFAYKSPFLTAIVVVLVFDIVFTAACRIFGKDKE